MGRTHVPSTRTLPGGVHVRLRMPHATDAPRLLALLDRLGLAVDPLEGERIVRFDPRVRAVVCAAVWVDGAEELAGVGTLDLHAGGQPDTLVADEALAPGIGVLLRDALIARAAVPPRRAA